MHFFQISYTKYVIDFEDKKIPKRIISVDSLYDSPILKTPHFFKTAIFLLD